MSNIQTQTVDRLTAEILIYKQQTAQNIIEIGKRLIEVKASLPHGEWGKWLEEKVDISHWNANKFMKVANEMANCGTVNNLSQSKVFALLDLPQEERETFIAETDIDSMTKRQLQAEIKARKLAEQELEELKNKPAEIKEVIKEVVTTVIPEDYEDLKVKAEKYNNIQLLLQQKEQELSLIKKEDSEYVSKRKKLLEEIGELENKADEWNKRYNQNTQMAKISVKMRAATSKVRENSEDIKILIKESSHMIDDHTRIECIYMIESLEVFCNEIRNLLAERVDIIDY